MYIRATECALFRRSPDKKNKLMNARPVLPARWVVEVAALAPAAAGVPRPPASSHQVDVIVNVKEEAENSFPFADDGGRSEA